VETIPGGASGIEEEQKGLGDSKVKYKYVYCIYYFKRRK
jgi:hypothetical protein